MPSNKPRGRAKGTKANLDTVMVGEVFRAAVHTCNGHSGGIHVAASQIQFGGTRGSVGHDIGSLRSEFAESFCENLSGFRRSETDVANIASDALEGGQ